MELCKQEGAAQMHSSFDNQRGDITAPTCSATVVYVHVERRMLYFFFLVAALLRYNSYTIQFLYLQCIFNDWMRPSASLTWF